MVSADSLPLLERSAVTTRGGGGSGGGGGYNGSLGDTHGPATFLNIDNSVPRILTSDPGHMRRMLQGENLAGTFYPDTTVCGSTSSLTGGGGGGGGGTGPGTTVGKKNSGGNGSSGSENKMSQLWLSKALEKRGYKVKEGGNRMQWGTE